MFLWFGPYLLCVPRFCATPHEKLFRFVHQLLCSVSCAFLRCKWWLHEFLAFQSGC